MPRRATALDRPSKRRTSVSSQPAVAWDWCLGSNSIPGMLVADLNEEQRTAVQSKLDAMVAERANGSGTAILTAPLNIGVGTK